MPSLGAAAACLVACWAAATGAVQPYQSLAGKGAGFHGPGREVEPPDTLSCVRLGLIGPAKGNSGLQLRHGVEMALAEANAAGGYRSLPYQLVFRPDDGPWGVVAHQVVRLSQEDQVWTVLGALDGQRAHAAELVAAKVWVPVITPAAGDLTIDYANVPWVFRLMPSDRAQAEVLLAAAAERGWERLAVASEATRDARLAAERLQEAARSQRRSPALHVEYDPRVADQAAARLMRVDPDAIVVWGTPAGAPELLASLRRAGAGTPLLLPAPLVLPEIAAAVCRQGGPAAVVGAAAVDLSAPDPRLQEFLERFRQDAGVEPEATAVFAYDAAWMVLRAIEVAGLNRARIRDELAHMRYPGLVGTVCFDALGGHGGRPVLVEARHGRWVSTPPAVTPETEPAPSSEALDAGLW